ncbi:MAG TPA: HAMP domain-containing sensor histidine kinase [Pseudoneobacillus sp.]|nr:HAMP domain-containing sensor histidine kinase [Pseudoneobacillus sp.]
MKDLIVQLFSTVFLTLLYQMFWEGKGKTFYTTTKNRIITFMIGSVSIWLCMTFPITILDGYLYDLRDVPLMIGILYGGSGVGVTLTAFMIGYRFIIGGHGVFLTILSHAIVLPFIFYQIKKFPHYSHKQRIKVTTLLSIFLSMMVMIVSLVTISLKSGFYITKDMILFFLYFVLSNTFGINILVFLIEKSRQQTLITQELQETEKMRVVSHLAASIAHEVRNPLTVVRGFIQMLAKENMNQEKMRIFGDLMLSELDRAQMIITDYLSFARPQPDPNNLETFDVKTKILKAVNVMVPYALVQGVEFKTTVSDQLFIRAEKSKLEQVLVNLIKNSIEAMPRGGTIQIRAEQQNKYILIDIIDQGVGMTSEQIEQLGNPFFTTKETGTGIGIMVCYRIIEALGGTLEVSSEVGKGTHFSILVPAETIEENMTV